MTCLSLSLHPVESTSSSGLKRDTKGRGYTELKSPHVASRSCILMSLRGEGMMTFGGREMVSVLSLPACSRPHSTLGGDQEHIPSASGSNSIHR